MVPPVLSDVSVRVQVYHDRCLGRQFFFFIQCQRAAHKVAEATVVAALDGKLIAVGVVDLFNAAGRRAQNAQGQIRLLGRLLP